MGLPLTVLGDKTDHGGTVMTATSFSLTGGKPIARVGDKVPCPKCNDPNAVIVGPGDPTTIVDGAPVSLHGDKTSCGATLIASQRPTTAGGPGGASKAAAKAQPHEAAFRGAANPFIQPPDEEGSDTENTHSACDQKRLYRDLAQSKVNLHTSTLTASSLATGSGTATDIDGLADVAQDMIDNYGKVGITAKVGRISSLAEFLMTKGIEKASGLKEASSRFEEAEKEKVIDAQKDLERAHSEVDACETNAQAREQAAAEQEKMAEAMDYLNEKNRLENDISGIALAAALTNTGAKLTHRDFEYRHSNLFPQTSGSSYTQTQDEYSNAPQWNNESLQAQQAHDELLNMARPIADTPSTGAMLPPPSVRQKELQQLQSVRNQMQSVYDETLKPIWHDVMNYWTDRPRGSV